MDTINSELDNWQTNTVGRYLCTNQKPMPLVFKNQGTWSHDDVEETDCNSDYYIEYRCKNCGHTWKVEMPD